MENQFTIHQLIETAKDLNKTLALDPPINTDSKKEALADEIAQILQYQDKQTGNYDLQAGDLRLLQPETVEVIRVLSPLAVERFGDDFPAERATRKKKKTSPKVTTSPQEKTLTQEEKIKLALIKRAEQEYAQELKLRLPEADEDQRFKLLHALDLKRTVNIPQAIIDAYLSVMSATAWKLLCGICRKATFDPKNPLFGTCRATHEQLAELTGIAKSSIRTYERELVALGLLDIKVIQTREKGTFRTVHHYSISFFKVRQSKVAKEAR
jgi:hypothetical protein